MTEPTDTTPLETTPTGPAPRLQVEAITLFPKMVEGPLSESILGRAQKAGLLKVTTRDLRRYGLGKHRAVDDTPYGGGAGMVMRPEPLVTAIEEARVALSKQLELQGIPAVPRVLLMDPQGTPFTQAVARRLSAERALILVCGRYEGIDERVRPSIDEAISLGDFVLTGGEAGAVCVIDAVARLLPGVLGNDASSVTESFGEGLLEGPQYTRPPEFRGQPVPEVLLNGDHAKIARWRRDEALRRTRKLRPDLLAQVTLDKADKLAIARLAAEETERTSSAAEGPGAVVGTSVSTRNSSGSSGPT